jgi:hypothetical protein
LDSGFFGGNSEQTALRADHIFGGNLNSDLLRRGGDSNSRDPCEPFSFQD